MTTVVVSGVVSDSLSGVDPSNGSFAVADDYGLIQPHGSLTVQSSGRYSVSLQLQAARNNNDKEGRHYTITVQAQDRAGNPCTVVTVVTVPLDQGHGK